MVDTAANALSIQTGIVLEAALEVEEESDSETDDPPKPERRILKAKRRIPGKLTFDKEGFPELKNELLEGKLVVKTKKGNTAMQ